MFGRNILLSEIKQDFYKRFVFWTAQAQAFKELDEIVSKNHINGQSECNSLW